MTDKEIKEKIEKIGQAVAELIKDVKEIKEKIGIRSFVSEIYGFRNKEDFEKLKNICSDLAVKDETFKFEANNEAKEIYVYSEDKNVLHKKSMWLVKKTGIEGLKYTIR